ncbi:MAG: indolepyruvate oxidoreductase subunit beta [Tepidanaerobacteraceae bacterium]|jgi:indolepyruvate ferredoxin oxidoreductase beta subunit|nr:indolepyruvate oxidoreductase subunit beta [Tepidanaerobacteraceae bacterium]
MADTGILIVGVGGQGTLLSSRILGEVALYSGFDVKVSEVHGMAQRGGSVVTHVRFGKRVYSPLVGIGQADFILAFEKLEALRWAGYLKKGGMIIANARQIPPIPVTLGLQKYPEDIDGILSGAATTHMVDASKIASDCGSPRSVNMVLLGVLASRLDFEKELWLKVIRETVPQNTVEINTEAFSRGYEFLQG